VGDILKIRRRDVGLGDMALVEVLQGLMARYSMADVVIQVACGERAGAPA
jgi:hypothetical protein